MLEVKGVVVGVVYGEKENYKKVNVRKYYDLVPGRHIVQLRNGMLGEVVERKNSWGYPEIYIKTSHFMTKNYYTNMISRGCRDRDIVAVYDTGKYEDHPYDDIVCKRVDPLGFTIVG